MVGLKLSKKNCLLYWCGLCALLLVGCSEPTKELSEESEAAPAQPARLALVVKYLGNPFFDEVARGATQAAKELGVDLSVYSTAGASGAQQIQTLKKLKYEGIDGIILMPVNSEQLIPAVVEVMMAGIPLMTIDTPLASTEFTENGLKAPPLITVDNGQAAYDVARFVLEQMTTPAQVLVLTGPRQAINIRERYFGFVRAVQDAPNAQLAAEMKTQWTILDGYQVSRQQFQHDPTINVVLAANDLLALGAAKAAAELNRKVSIAGYDNLAEAREAIALGQLTATIDQSAFAQGYQGVVSTLKLMEQQPVDDNVLLPVSIVSKETLDAFTPTR
ncbi:substrate-binding domain-containing protein [Neiella marina]|uniref:Substrate-binding domain-containing protein n=1 Tax=Neiella holothuriorum TaxID=2870530 RepID=A0ABS7EH37_9GAMM|nr:substrate-binding domain-containing protein [Neiella holothuriorum]MBW8191096.1 substrate-binding domain-containing protein [Neiella holothuriorum]